MITKLFDGKFKISSFSVVIFVFFLLVSVLSLHIVREKILDNSRIMGQEIAARFAIRETARIKGQEMLLRSVAQSMGSLMTVKKNWTDKEIELLLDQFTEYMESNTEVARFDMCAVIDSRFINSETGRKKHSQEQVIWYKAALDNRGQVVYTKLYQSGPRHEYVLTMAVTLGNGDDVLAMNLYPEQLNALLADNRLPRQSYYYLCDANGNIMFAINDREMTLEEQQPYVDHIFSEIRHNEDEDYIIDLEGNKRGVYYTVSEKGWISVVTIPYEFLLGNYENTLLWFVLTLVVIAFMVLFLGMREHVLSRKMQNINEAVQVMSKSFFAVFRLNLRTGRYSIIKAEHMGFEPEQKGYYEDLLQDLIPQIEPEAAAEFAETFSLSNMKDLIHHKVYEFGGDFRQKIDKHFKWMNVRLMWDELLGVDEALLFFRDVDDEKLKELEHLQVTEHALKVARENTKARNMFFSAMSHDMRAPLNGIIGMAELAEIHHEDKNLVSDYVRKIKSSGKQLLTLINDILEMAQLDNAKVKHLQELFDMTIISKDIGEMFAAQAELENKVFSQKILLPPVRVLGDLQGLQQILNNVLSNALKYTPAEGRISFLVRCEGKTEKNRAQFTFIIRDTGCGMSEKFLEKIYTPFERETRFGAAKVVGTGLGMTIVKSLVDRMEGTIAISSKVDEGTCVMISLPFQLVDEEVQVAPEAPKLKDFAGCHVLVADDNDISMEIITELLKMNGLEVLPAANGREALEKFAATPEGSVDIVLLDVQMPEMDGFEAAAEMRRLQRSDAARVPILALTASSSNEDVELAKKCGMNDYMVKPVKMKLLAQMMDKYLRKGNG